MPVPCTENTIEFEALENLTVIIPSYERQDFLLRQLIYWKGTKVKLIIADGSKIPIDAEILKQIPTSLQVTYLHNQASFSERLNMAAAHINTQYAVLSGDDEFLLKYGLCCAMQKLQQEPSLVACIGQSLGFYLPGSNVDVSYGTGYPHWKYEIRQDDQAERLRAAMINYTAATCYAVQRADTWRRSWGSVRNWTSPYVAEVQQAISTYLSGKLSTVDEVYWMRAYENKPISIKGSNRTLSFEEWWTSNKFVSERNEFVDTLVKEAAKTGKVDLVQAHRLIEEAIETFLAPEHQRRSALSGLAALAALLRSQAGKILKMVLSEGQFIKLRGLVDASRGKVGRGNFGSIRELSQIKDGAPFRVNDMLLSELSNMEKLIDGFHKARLDKQ